MDPSDGNESASEPPALDGVDYFDGRSAEAQAVRLRIVGTALLVSGASVERSVPLSEVQWPERTRHGARMAHLVDGGSLQTHDGAAWDHWLAASGRREPAIVTLQQSWRAAGASVVALSALLAAVWLWGVPWAAQIGVVAIPRSVDVAIGKRTLVAIDRSLMRPSALTAAEQTRIDVAFERALAASPAGSIPPHRLVFRSSRLGPNAFALPGGTLVLTDELVRLVDADTSVLTGVLAHEIGHLQHRHGMRLLLQATAIGAVASLVVGDFSTLLAAVPVLLGEASYSRDAEREADAEAVRILKAAGISPLVMVTFFDKVALWRGDDDEGEGVISEPRAERRLPGDADATGPDATPEPSPDRDPNRNHNRDRDRRAKRDDNGHRDASGLGIAIASHPADAERIRYFREAAQR